MKLKGIVTETKYGKTRSAQMKTSVFATSNNIKKMSAPLQSRFFIVELEPYTQQQFCGITRQLLSSRKRDEGVAVVIADAVWNKAQDIRECIKIGILAKSTEDIEFIADKFFGPMISQCDQLGVHFRCLSSAVRNKKLIQFEGGNFLIDNVQPPK